MGVTGLWSIVQPCARPTKIETLNRKRLAVDASIWIYQFLKAVRDKEGNALRNSHVVGFFRRICKLLFFGIKPVFVFDGGAPALKRSVIRDRKRRREGRRDDAVRTAGKLLAVQMQRRAEEEEHKRKEAQDHPAANEEAVPEEGLVYVDELFTSAPERQQNRTKFKKKDAYHLPELDVSMNEMGGPNDPRVMSLEELQDYARQFNTGEDVNVYDFSKIDYDSAFFTSLPASDRYNILNAARLRSRLRMGHSKEQLDTMFPDRMAFSKFQIERVTERNELTQRLMHLNEGGDSMFDSGARIAGEKGREYVLVKNDGVEGGWALGVVNNEGRSANEAIDLDEAPPVKEQSEISDDEEFEDVAIEGLNRLPKQPEQKSAQNEEIARQRRAVYRARKQNTKRKSKPAEDPDSLFVAEESEHEDDLVADGDSQVDEDEELNRAIAMSMQQDEPEEEEEETRSENEENDMLDVFHQAAVSEALPVPKGSGRTIANIVNRRAFHAAPESQEVTSFGVPVPKHEASQGDDEDNGMDLQAALAESRRTKRKKTPPGPRFKNVQPHTPTKMQTPTKSSPTKSPPKKPALRQELSASDIAKEHGFSGPLPFEKLDLGSSLLGKKKTVQAPGGFDLEVKKTEPVPPWFSGDLKKDLAKQREVEDEDRQRAKEFNEKFQFDRKDGLLRRFDTGEVIDLEDESHPVGFKQGETINLDDEPATQPETADDNEKLDEVAEDVRADPPTPALPDERRPAKALFEDDGSQSGEEAQPVATDNAQDHPVPEASDDEQLEWSDSEDEKTRAVATLHKKHVEPAGGVVNTQSADFSADMADITHNHDIDEPISMRQKSRSPSAEFEDVDIPDRPASPPALPAFNGELVHGSNLPTMPQEETIPEDFDDFSDPEDEELLRNLAQEAEEHARFESTLNNKSVAQNFADYEKELKQLRNQQKKDRRDADEVTHIMITECQQLLQLFGLPYITAPMEAEAQCAELVRLGLVDGIVTDDSDCFLFGGTRVYKNVFNQAKFVECYLTSDLEKEFDLTRDKLIAVAHLLGSDYTEGLPGVGPVTALEILAEFGDLKAFKDWWSGVQDLSITKQDDSGNTFKKKFRKNATKLFLPPAFPDERVSIAYNTPEVDSSNEHFQWGVPDLGALRAYLMATIGWSQERTDEVLVPVIKDMNRRMDEGTQSNITAFFEGGIGAGAAGRGQGGEAFAPRRRIDTSKRMGKAMGLMANQAKTKKRNATDVVEDATHSAEPINATNGDVEDEDGPPKQRQKRKKRN